MRIYTLENKNEILAILTHTDNMSYREFKRICNEANEEAENDFYVLKDILINDYMRMIRDDCKKKVLLKAFLQPSIATLFLRENQSRLRLLSISRSTFASSAEMVTPLPIFS
jgi:hypothetical protein